MCPVTKVAKAVDFGHCQVQSTGVDKYITLHIALNTVQVNLTLNSMKWLLYFFLNFDIFLKRRSTRGASHRRKFGNHVTVQRPIDRPPARPSVRTTGIPM